jgi:hypothetical protein
MHMPRHLTRTRLLTSVGILAIALTAAIPGAAWNVISRLDTNGAPRVPDAREPAPDADPVEARRAADFDAMRTFRPGYAFWQHVFTLPDGRVAFGSAVNGRLLATIPAKGPWTTRAAWIDPALADVIDDEPLARRPADRREQIARLLERAAGPVLSNSTRGDALTPNAARYGRFLVEWGTIYERFGVPADIGLGQVILESGLCPRRRSEANAVGFCQWLQKNWRRLNYFAQARIEGQNQTTQAPYCAAYLSVLATKYGSFIPALSEHNAGGTNVGRALIIGEQLGATDVRARYFLGSRLALALRDLPGREYDDVYRTYGPRSHRYAEMVFGNTFIVRRLIASTPQVAIHAMRTPRAISLAEIMARTGLTAVDVRRFNPALVDRVPADATLYLPTYVREFGPDVSFWRRPPDPSYAAVLHDFLRLPPGPERWDDPSFAPILAGFRARFRDTGTEEGRVMGTVLAYAMDQAYTSGRHRLLNEFRNSEDVRTLIERGVLELRARSAQAGPTAE